MARAKTVRDNPARRKPDGVSLPFFRAWQRAIGMPSWRIMAATDLADSTLYKAETGQPIGRATARLLAIALEVPLDLLLRVGPDHDEARAVVQRRAKEVQKELTELGAVMDARSIAFSRAPAPERTAA